MASNSERLNKWALLCMQDPAFLDSAKLAYVFDSGNQALLVTKDDDVYTIGRNDSGCSGIDTNTRDAVGGKKCIITPRKVDALCKKQLNSIVSGNSQHVLAITRSGKVYSWGYNGIFELGHGTNTPNPNPTPTVIAKLDQVKVKQVACGCNHSMALTEDGKVFTWGHNAYGQVGNGSTTNCSVPYHIQLGDAKCEMITCTYYSSFAVTDRGKVYSWGYNNYGELGIGSTTNQTSPKEITALDKQVISQIVGGYLHVLALTDDGMLYAWGYNCNGELGIGSTTNSNVPVQVGVNLGRFLETAASIYYDCSAAVLSNGKVYIWGNYFGKSLVSPVLSGFNQLDDAFSSPVAPFAMWRSLVLGTDTTNVAVAQEIGQHFNDKESADVTFVFSGNEEPIYAHKTILKMRSGYFDKMFSGKWNENAQNRQEIKDVRQKIYKAYIQYLYTNKVDVTPIDAVELMQLADKNCEADLVKRCEALIIHGITTDNALDLITIANKYNLKNLEERCYNYAINHLTAVVNSDAFKNFDKNLEKKLVSMASKLKIFKT